MIVYVAMLEEDGQIVAIFSSLDKLKDYQSQNEDVSEVYLTYIVDKETNGTG